MVHISGYFTKPGAVTGVHLFMVRNAVYGDHPGVFVGLPPIFYQAYAVIFTYFCFYCCIEQRYALCGDNTNRYGGFTLVDGPGITDKTQDWPYSDL